MGSLAFKKSATASIGTELEYQLIDPETYNLVSRAKDLIRNVKSTPFQLRIVPEITQCMIEVNTSVHQSPQTMLEELAELQQFLLEQCSQLNIAICGGGTHPFETWKSHKIFPASRYRKMFRKYRYLSKRATVFGQHIHIGCASGEDALYLTHAMARYTHQLIALSAASPFYQGIYTGYHSARSTIFSSYPSSGVIPYLINWDEFSAYFTKMCKLGIVNSMKDFYWDIRPKPEFGTVEIRVCDTPLTIQQAVTITAFVQALSLYLLNERPIQVKHDLYYLYAYNRFQASRYGFQGHFINPYTMQDCLIIEDFFNTIKLIEKYTKNTGNMGYINQLLNDAKNNINGTAILKEIYKKTGSFPKMVAEQCKLWAEPVCLK